MAKDSLLGKMNASIRLIVNPDPRCSSLRRAGDQFDDALESGSETVRATSRDDVYCGETSILNPLAIVELARPRTPFLS